MAKKSLVLYASITGNTEKVALRFQKVFVKKGWECDVFKVDKNTDTRTPALNYGDYDFLCVGSPVIKSLPVGDVLNMLINVPSSLHYGRGFKPGETMEELMAEYKRHHRELRESGKKEPQASSLEIVFGPDDKKGVVFVTFAGLHQGPKEAEPALSIMESELEHLRFECVGKFASPGQFGNMNNGWFGDLRGRPNERDLLKAEIFLEEILERI